jgi:hypothetical protein
MVKKTPSAAASARARTLRREMTEADPAQLIADLQRQLAACRAERNQAPEYQTATRFIHPPPRCLDGGGPRTPTRIDRVTPTPTLPHQGGGSQRRGGLEATPDDPTESAQRIADLQRQLAECRAERDQARAQPDAVSKMLGVIDLAPVRTGSRSHPPPRWGRARVGVIALIGVRVTDRPAAGVIPRTDPW